MERTFLTVSLAWAGLVACAAPSLPEIPPSHPASPLAAEAALAPPSNALAPPSVAEPAPDGATEDAPPSARPHGAHHGH